MLDLVEGVLSEFADAQGLATYPFEYGTLPARVGSSEAERAAGREYYAKHKAERKAYLTANADKVRAGRRARYAADPQRAIEQNRAWRARRRLAS